MKSLMEPIGFGCPKCGKVSSFIVERPEVVHYPNGEIESQPVYYVLNQCRCETEAKPPIINEPWESADEDRAWDSHLASIDEEG